MLRRKRCVTCGETKPVSSDPKRSGFTRRRDSRDGYRGQCKECFDKSSGSTGRKAAGGGHLPVGPFRDWLAAKLEAYNGSTELLAEATGLHDRQIRRILNESKSVALDTVDRALCNERSTFLWELGYSEGDFVHAAAECEKTEKKRR